MTGDGGVGPLGARAAGLSHWAAGHRAARALDDAGFRAEALAPAARIPHDADWADRIAAVLGG